MSSCASPRKQTSFTSDSLLGMHVSTNASITCWYKTEISRKIGQCMSFLCALAKLQKRLLASSYSVHLSAWKNLTATEWIFMKSVIWVFFGNLLRNFKSHEILTRIPGSFHEYQYNFFFTISRSVLLRMRNVSDNSNTENQNTHFYKQQFFFENCAVYEITWKNIVQLGRPQMYTLVSSMCIACWIIKDTS